MLDRGHVALIAGRVTGMAMVTVRHHVLWFPTHHAR